MLPKTVATIRVYWKPRKSNWGSSVENSSPWRTRIKSTISKLTTLAIYGVSVQDLLNSWNLTANGAGKVEEWIAGEK